MWLDMSGSNRNRANSWSEDSHNGNNLLTWGSTTLSRYRCSVRATCSSAQADRTAIRTMVCALEPNPRRSPTAGSEESLAVEDS